MTAPGGIRSGVGFRNVVLFALNANGTPAAASPTTPYEGVRLTGARTLTITDPSPRNIPYQGDDGVISLDVLPPNEAITGELHTGKVDDIVDAILTNQKALTVGTTTLFGLGTEKRGFEPQVGLLAYRQAQDTNPVSSVFGARVWDFIIMPKVQLITKADGFQDTPTEHIYTIVPAKVGAHLWGTAFAEANDGYLQAQAIRGLCYGKPKIISWLANNTATDFTFPAAMPPLSTASIVVFIDGVATTAGITLGLDKIVFATAPANNKRIDVLYEY